MAENPKDVLRWAVAKRAADAEAAKRAAKAAATAKKQREYEEITRGALNLDWDAPLPPETPQSEWVRENMEWENSLNFWEPPNCSYSDYSGSFVEKSNVQALLRDHPEIFTENGGGHGWTACGITEEKRLALTEEEWEAIKDVIEGLHDYPLVDEELHSEMEWEAKSEHWEEYGREEVREALLKKFDGDPDAQIAVVSRPNEFWDTMMREHEWDQNMTEETGCNIYFRAESAVSSIGRDEIVNDDLVEEVKKRVFTDEVANKLGAALQREGVDVNSDAHLWQMVQHADQATDYALWDVEQRVRCGKGECDPTDYVTFDINTAVEAITQPEFHQKMLARHWAEDPRQLKLPGLESKASALAAALLDGEDPKSMLAQLPRFQFKSSSFQGDQVFLQSEEGQDWPIPLGCVTADPDRQYRICNGAMTRLGWKWWERVSPEVFSMQFPDRDSAATKLWALWKQSGAVRESEDPKSVLRMAKDPQEIARHWIGNMPKEIEIWGRRWFSRTHGNTYFTARIYVDGQLVHTMPEEYGYGNHYLHRAFEWLEDNGHIPKRPRNRSNVPEAPWRWAEIHGFKLTYHAEDIRRRRDRFVEAEDPKAVLRSAGLANLDATLSRLKPGTRVRIRHSVPGVVDHGDTGVVYEFPFGGEAEWASVNLDNPRDENWYPFKVSELEII